MKRTTGITAAVLLAVGIASTALGHGGGVDGYGGHNDRKAGTYHFHSGPLAGQTFPSKAAALEALRRAQVPKPPTPAPSALAEDGPTPAEVIRRASTTKKLDALIALLVRKQLITEAELAAELAR